MLHLQLEESKHDARNIFLYPYQCSVDFIISSILSVILYLIFPSALFGLVYFQVLNKLKINLQK